jgi:predicted transcriptional regulator
MYFLKVQFKKEIIPIEKQTRVVKKLIKNVLRKNVKAKKQVKKLTKVMKSKKPIKKSKKAIKRSKKCIDKSKKWIAL